MLEILTDNETRLMAENDELKFKIGRALHQIDAVAAIHYDDEVEAVILQVINDILKTLASGLRA